MSKYRNWCWTLNNPTYEDTKKIIQCDKYTYIIWGFEIGENGTFHYQGYVEFTNQKRLDEVKKDLGSRIHFEQRRGSQEQAINYCKKTGDIYEYGALKQQGSRSDLNNIYEDIKNGDTIMQIAEKYPSQYIRYNKGIKELKFVLNDAKNKFRDVKTTCVIGAADSGKTYWVYDHAGISDLYKLDADKTVWWDGYEGEKNILIDDFYGDYITYGKLLNILDKYPLRLPTKGGHTYANWDNVYITSNNHPKTWYKEGMSPALARRIHSIVDLASEVSGNTATHQKNTILSNFNPGILDEIINDTFENEVERASNFVAATT